MSESDKMKAVAVSVTTTPNVVERGAGPFGERTVAPTHGVTGSLGTEQRRDQRELQRRSLSRFGDVGGENGGSHPKRLDRAYKRAYKLSLGSC